MVHMLSSFTIAPARTLTGSFEPYMFACPHIERNLFSSIKLSDLIRNKTTDKTTEVSRFYFQLVRGPVTGWDDCKE
jgi:hypothetical protein